MMPVIDNFEIRVVDQFADPIPVGDRYFIVDTFRLEPIEGVDLKTLQQRSNCFVMGSSGITKCNDALNSLVLKGELSWQAVDMFRCVRICSTITFPYNMFQINPIFKHLSRRLFGRYFRSH